MAAVVTPDWPHNMDNNRQRTSPTTDGQAQATHTPSAQQQQQQQLLHQQQQMLLAAQQQQPGFTYPVQQQPQGSWTPNITAPPFYPSFYQNHAQQVAQPSYQTAQAPYFDPANANAQLAAQWAYQQMMFSAQHGFPQHISPSQRPPNTNPQGAPQMTPDYFTQVASPVFNPFPSGTPPPQSRPTDQQGQEYPGFHPYRRPSRQPSSPAESAAHERRQPQGQRQGIGQAPHPPYARPDASGSSSSINSSSSQRQRTNSNQSAHSSGHNSQRGASPAQSSRGSPSPVASSSSSPLRQPHIRNGSSSSSVSTSTATSIRPSSSTTTATSVASASTTGTSSAPPSATPRPARPSPLSQGNFTASDKRRSRDDIDLGALHSEATPTASMIRSGGLKGRLRRALSFNAAQTLKEEAEAEVAAEKAAAEGRDDGEEDDDDVSIKASQVNGKLKANTNLPTKLKSSAASGTEDEGVMSPSTSSTSMPVKKKGRAASLFNSRLNASTDNISLSSTVSSASVMIRKLGAMGKLARRNSLAGITSLFKDKDKSKDKDEGSSKGKKKEKDKKTAKSSVAVASVSHATAELDRPSATGDWSVGADMHGLSPAAKLARQHTLKSNAEAAAKAKEAREAKEKEAAAAAAAKGSSVFSTGIQTQVPTWDRNTATRQGSASPVKGGTGAMRVNEDGTRTLIEEEDEESDDGHFETSQHRVPQGQDPQGHRAGAADGWDDDEDWDVDGDGDHEDDEDVTIRMGVQQRESLDTAEEYSQAHLQHPDVEPWAVDARRSAEKARKPTKGILKHAESYDQHVYLNDPSYPSLRARSNSYTAPPAQSELGPLAHMPPPDPDHIDGLHRHGSHSSGGHGASVSSSSLPDSSAPFLPPLAFDINTSRFSTTFVTSPLALSNAAKDLPETPTTAMSSTTSSSSVTSVATSSTQSSASGEPTPVENRTSAIFQHPNLSAPALSTMGSSMAPTLSQRSATMTSKKLTFATNLSVYDTFSASVYDRRSEPATWSRLTPALAQRIKEELNSYKMEEMEVHAASRIHTQFFV